MHTLRALALGLAGIMLASTLGCQEQRDQIVAAYPASSALLGGRPKPSPFVLSVGNIQGFVFGAQGKTQPIRLAFVSTGSVSTIAGNPSETDEATAVADEPDDGKEIKAIMHEFDDGKGEVLAERRVRKKPPGTSLAEKYIYLRPGEFFLEGVPEGIANLRASFGNVNSTPNPITVYPNNTVTDVSMNLYIPEPRALEGGAAVKVVSWTGLNPDNGILVSFQIKEITKQDGGSTKETTITYKPDPPDVSVTLKAPPGSQGNVIRAIDIVYVYNTPERQSLNQLPIQIGPVRLPISPKIVAPAQEIAFGPPTNITVPIGSASLRVIFDDPNPIKTPGLIIANLEFITEDGFAVQDENFQKLQVAVVLRAL